MTNKLDIFDVLKHIDKRDVAFFDSLSDEDKKQFVPLLTMRWLSSGTNLQTELTNSVVNPMVFRMYKHPGVLYKLMVACSDGKSRRYQWIKKKSKDKSCPVSAEVISIYYQCSKKEAARFKNMLTLEDVLDMGESLGYDSDQLKKIKAEFK